MTRRRRLTLEEYEAGVVAGDRAVLAQAVTLIESRADGHRRTAEELLTRLMPKTGGARRVGITGVPGVGKSTFIDQLGVNLTAAGRRVAVLAVDPSSTRTGGSILGDKTRMARLATDPNAFIRPSPTAGALGGVASRTRETMLLCEAAGFDVVLVETVGVGQSETVVADMTDFFLVLLLAGAGDELQGIKRGILELADLLAVNKADGDNRVAARRAASQYRSAMRLMHPGGGEEGWLPPVMTCSALDNDGVDAIWQELERHLADLEARGALAARRSRQALSWTWALVRERLDRALRDDERVAATLPETLRAVETGALAPPAAARRIVEAFHVE